MDPAELADRLHHLQVSLQDGDDLARAIGLISDALERRMADLRERLRWLRDAKDVPPSDLLESIIDRVEKTLDRYEEGLDDRHARMEELVLEFQRALRDDAEGLTAVQEELGVTVSD